jgi:hypothetical protein
VTWDTKLLRVYVDGARGWYCVCAALDTVATYNKYVVGAWSGHSATAHHLRDGRVDEPKAYDYALSADEVMQLYTLGMRLTQD